MEEIEQVEVAHPAPLEPTISGSTEKYMKTVQKEKQPCSKDRHVMRIVLEASFSFFGKSTCRNINQFYLFRGNYEYPDINCTQVEWKKFINLLEI